MGWHFSESFIVAKLWCIDRQQISNNNLFEIIISNCEICRDTILNKITRMCIRGLTSLSFSSFYSLFNFNLYLHAGWFIFIDRLSLRNYIFNTRIINDENITGRILQRSCAKTFNTYGDILAAVLSLAYYLFSGPYSALVNSHTVCFCCQPPSCRGS